MARRLKLSRQQLLEHLKILDSLPPPLPASLPPSPPASPPSFLGKRKQDVVEDSDRVKRHRSSQPLPPPLSLEPAEDGEVSESPQTPSPPPPSALPVRRPKHGTYPTSHHDSLYNKYHQEGRELKFSGDARFWSTFPRTAKDYRPLADPPPTDSPYHKNGIQIAKLELLDALIRFTFAMWNKEYSRGICYFESWDSSMAYIDWCKSKWVTDDSTSEAEKAFRGLIDMIRAFILIRKAVFYNRHHLKPQAAKMFESVKESIATAIDSSDPSNALLAAKSRTPPMLPSPANSIGATNSANSTPTGSGSTPSTSTDDPSSTPSVPVDAVPAMKIGPAIPRELLPPNKLSDNRPIPPHVVAAANSVSLSVKPQLIHTLHSHSQNFAQAAHLISSAENVLNLPIIARHFPRTFARMIYTSLSPNEEYEPDFEDEEGELFWPTQCASGDGLGWVCLLGQAMIKEYGKPYGYVGHAGIIKKPQAERQRPRPLTGR
ncbi:hypothetical protein D9758_001965 [Tetrapyrgos nigripes]|uniref:Uncharacterized protein n=1 Tax=Tetrapyrgos nigripes TaxID=182062 RepID=A0A8H5LV98_9AGAR|nr:hypothetical protein D9758_001965 [Tetrapyrgos nigripes]